jgi:hypothetical protein
MSHPLASRREAGSAYIMALLVLVVLSVMGLALALVSQTELQIGANELTVHRVLYGADSGIDQNLARYLTSNTSVESVSADATGGGPLDAQVNLFSIRLPEVRYELASGGALVEDTTVPAALEQQITVSPFVPIRATCCDMCPCGEGDVELVSVNHAVISTSGRGNVEDIEADPEDAYLNRGNRKQIYEMVGVQPWWEPSWEAIADDERTQEIVQEVLGDFSEN